MTTSLSRRASRPASATRGRSNDLPIRHRGADRFVLLRTAHCATCFSFLQRILTMPVLLPYVPAIVGALSAGAAVYSSTQGGPKPQAAPQNPKEPTQNGYKDRNAQNAMVGGDSTGTGSLLTNP